MEKNLLNNYVLDLLESIEQNLSTYTKDKQPEGLHRLRIELKKIKAVIYFAENIYKEKYDATKLNPLFHKAGKIREMQINIHLLSTVPDSPKRLIAQLKKRENILIQQFVKNGSRSILIIKNFVKKVCLPEILPSKKTIINYFKKERSKANKILRHKKREDMHGYRKKIKKMMYIYNALPKEIQKQIELNETEINKQQKKLGNWHDNYSAVTFFSNVHFPMQTSEFILKLKEKEKRQFNALSINFTEKGK